MTHRTLLEAFFAALMVALAERVVEWYWPTEDR